MNESPFSSEAALDRDRIGDSWNNKLDLGCKKILSTSFHGQTLLFCERKRKANREKDSEEKWPGRWKEEETEKIRGERGRRCCVCACVLA